MDKKTISEVMREMGRKGGKVGGKRALETMTPEERSARAKKASRKAAEVRTEKAAAKSAEVRSRKAAAKKKGKDR